MIIGYHTLFQSNDVISTYDVVVGGERRLLFRCDRWMIQRKVRTSLSRLEKTG